LQQALLYIVWGHPMLETSMTTVGSYKNME